MRLRIAEGKPRSRTRRHFERALLVSVPMLLPGCLLGAPDKLLGSGSKPSTDTDSTLASEGGATGDDTQPEGGELSDRGESVVGAGGTGSAGPMGGAGGAEPVEMEEEVETMEPAEPMDSPPPPPPHFTLDCGARETFASDVVSDWQQEDVDTPFSERGHEAVVDVQGMPLYVEEGPIFATVPGGPVDLVFDASSVYLFIEAEEVVVTPEGGEPGDLGPGLVVLKTNGRNSGSGIGIAHAELEGIAGISARLDPVPVVVPNRQANHFVRGLVLDTDERMVPTPGLPSELVSVQESARRMASGDLFVEYRAIFPVFVDADGVAQTLTDIELMSIRGEDGMFVSTLRPYSLDLDRLALRIDGEGRFAFSSDFTGTVQVDSLGYPRPEDANPPVALFGTQASLSITEAGEVTGEAQLTQALDDAGLLAPAHVQMAPTSVQVELAPGEQLLQPIHVREGSFLADGFGASVELSGDLPEGTVLLRADVRPSWLRVFDIVDDAGWVGAPTLAVIATVGSIATIVGETFECVFSFGLSCDLGFPDGFKSYDPVTQAGEVGDFEIALNGVGEVGDHYAGTLTFDGQNHCPVSIGIQVDIVCKPTGDEVCSDGEDNDCNGAADCDDAACLGLACNADDEAAVCTEAGSCE